MDNQLDLFGQVPLHHAPEYFNTTHLTEPLLGEARTQARLQEMAVLAIMRGAQKGVDGLPEPMGPSAVWTAGQSTLGESWLLTSVRRAMTNLTSAGKLQKLAEKTDGAYGRPEHLWRLTPILGAEYGTATRESR